MNSPLPLGHPAPRPATTAAHPPERPVRADDPPRAGRQPGAADDEPAPTDGALVVPQPTVALLGAWQAALLARETLPLQAAAGTVADRSATQQTVASAAAGRDLPADPLAPALASLSGQPVLVEFRPGAGPAWQLAVQRTPDAAAWSLSLATPSVPPALAATQLPRLERRLRQQGHAVEPLGWHARPQREQEEP